jgi:TetR/AcrR family transcriptional regulator, transcriptional repressor for nem operon
MKPATTHRGRPRKASREQIIERATNLFWQRGYHATSIADLKAATGVNLGSLYSEFSSKQELYEAALSYYRKSVVLKRRAEVEKSSNALEGIERFFEILITHALEEPDRFGCLNTNTCVELGTNDPVFRKIAKKSFLDWRKFWARTVKLGQKSGHICSKLDPDDTACMIIALAQGINVVGKAVKNRQFLEGPVKSSLRILRGNL